MFPRKCTYCSNPLYELTSHYFNVLPCIIVYCMPSGGVCTGCFSLLGGVIVYIVFIITCIYVYYMYFTSIQQC